MLRALSIWRVCIKYDLGRFLQGRPNNWRFRFIALNIVILLTRFLGWLLRPIFPLSLDKGEDRSKELALRQALEELGPIFTKFGQILSTRTDMLTAELVTQLSYLQDRVAPFPSEQIVNIIKKSLGGEIEDFFSEFEHDSCNSASVAQVHYGVLKKEKVAVAIKVIKPDIQNQIQRDVKFLYSLARIITATFPNTERLLLAEVVHEFKYVLENELNMQQEGANASQLSRNFSSTEDAALMKVPKIYWDYSSRDVLVLERIFGVAINNVEELKKHNIDLRFLAEKGVRIFFTQVFRDSFFHADMHPGNIFVDISDPSNPIYRGVDFGIMGSLSAEDKQYLALNLLAFFERDYRRVAELHINCGWVSRDTRVEQLEAAVRGVCEPIFAKPLNEIHFGQVLAQLIQTAKRFNMQVQPQLILLQKTLINVEGLGRQLYPQLNIWETATPILKKWLVGEIGVRNIAKTTRKLYPEMMVRIPKIANNLAWAIERFNYDFDGWAAEYQYQKGQAPQVFMGSKMHMARDTNNIHRKLRNTRLALWLSVTLATVSISLLVYILIFVR